jgi:SAM-dependent methyltransferase
MSNPNREFDKTYLSIDKAEERGLVHRDYIAHCFRWSHVVRQLLKNKSYVRARVLDVGCGKELPLAKLLYVNKMSPAAYVGVDMNELSIPPMLAEKKMPLRLFHRTDALRITPELLGWNPNFIVSFEVLEHMSPGHARKMLEHFRSIMTDDGVVIISTPCWNGNAAANHINEMTYKALGAMIEDIGFWIEGHWGTFASQKEYYDVLVQMGGGRFFDLLSGYYDTNVLATIFAPLFPSLSRNVCWQLRKNRLPNEPRKFTELIAVPGPWSQHKDWRDMHGEA